MESSEFLIKYFRKAPYVMDAIKVYKETKCHLSQEWKKWSKEKQQDRLFMICPSCGKNGSHVGEK